ncbi:MAG: GspH/FimT family pseudopilin [Gammaproteobacteria bacterium]|nr:GspH/FimT family pseudopilin [Gammaproteobacteria bacterium]
MHRRLRGFSLYELLLSLTLIAILVGLGVPAFSGITARARISAEINALFHALHVARKESVVRRQIVVLCPSVDGQRCAGGRDWSSGWIMFNDRDHDWPPQRRSGEPLLLTHIVADSVKITANRGTFTLRSTQKRATNGTLIVCDRAGRVASKALVVSYTGRPRVATETTRGEPYRCAD